MHKADRRLAEKVLAGDRRAAQTIADRLRDDFFNLFVWLTRDRGLAEDLAQAAFVRVWERLPDFRGESSLRTWAHRIAFSVVAVHERRATVEGRALSGYAAEKTSASPDSVTNQVEMRLALLDALAQLSEAECRVVVLCKLHGFTIAEAAAIVGQPPGTVGRQLAEAVKKLRSLLADWRDECRTSSQKRPILDQGEANSNVSQRP